MTEIVERALERLRGLPSKQQDDIALAVLRLMGDEGPLHRLTPDEAADLDRADDAIARGQFATEAEVQAVWSKHGL